MIIRELFTKEAKCCLSSDTCREAGEIMEEFNCGFVPVINDRQSKKLVGGGTDRDIALCLTRSNRAAGMVRVEECMSMDPVTISESSDLDEAIRRMEQAKVHRLPVVDRGGRLLGVLSLKDIALLAGREEVIAHPTGLELQLAEIVESIAASR